jgi:hypothetical protein
MTRTIYLLRATTGSYSDRSEWTVRAYASEESANAARAEAEACTLEASRAHRAEIAKAKAFGGALWHSTFVSRLDPDLAARCLAADPALVSERDGGFAWGFPYDSPDYSVEPVELVG